MARFCPMRRAFIAPGAGLIVLTEEAIAAGTEAARWFVGYDRGEIAVWEGWR